ncbi:MAG: hypothetical protein CVU03_01365 [Bacteroidetes bacterium HGW-Bacteroidetes-2]|jgi:hypothetical protein|nr:MAG: hypothetical protein CVU03_01365 [Bacteroidetes bacterium HGW-Bacteroidetes-2]
MKQIKQHLKALLSFLILRCHGDGQHQNSSISTSHAFYVTSSESTANISLRIFKKYNFTHSKANLCTKCLFNLIISASHTITSVFNEINVRTLDFRF